MKDSWKQRGGRQPRAVSCIMRYHSASTAVAFLTFRYAFVKLVPTVIAKKLPRFRNEQEPRFARAFFFLTKLKS